MSCVYKYNGKAYSEAELVALINKGEFAGILPADSRLYKLKTQGEEDAVKTAYHHMEKSPAFKYHKGENYYFVVPGKRVEAITLMQQLNNLYDLPIMGKFKKIKTASGQEREVVSFIDKNVEMISAMSADALISTLGKGKKRRFYPVQEAYEFRISQLYKQIASLQKDRQAAKKAKDLSEIKRLTNSIQAKHQTVDNIKERLKELKDSTKWEDLLAFAKEDLDIVKKHIRSRSVDISNIHYINKIIKLWQKIGDFNLSDGEVHIVFNDGEVDNDALRDGFSDPHTGAFVPGFTYFKNEMDLLSNELREIEEEILLEFVKEYTSDDLALDQIYTALKDIGQYTAGALSVNETSDPMLQTIGKAIKAQNFKARRETKDVNEKIDEMMSKLIPKLKALKKKDDETLYDIFLQFYDDGRKTGSLVSPYSPEYFETHEKLRMEAEADPKKWKNFFNWQKENTMLMDPRMLFPATDEDGTYFFEGKTFSAEEIEEHKEELRDQLGDYQYERLMSRLEEKIESFQLEFQVAMDRIFSDPSLSDSEKLAAAEMWDKTNSPYWAAQARDTKRGLKIKGEYVRTKGHQYTYVVPLRYDNYGKETKWYDKNFDTISKDPDLREFYEFMVETIYNLNKLLPYNYNKDLNYNHLPKIEKTLLESIVSGQDEKMSRLIIDGLGDEFIKLLRSNNQHEVDYRVDPVTKEEQKDVIFHMGNKEKQELKDRMEVALLTFQQEEGRVPNSDEIAEMKRDIVADIARNKSYDLGKILKFYSFAVTSFHHKAAIEDYVKLLERHFKSRKEIRLNASGQPMMTKDGKLSTQEGLENYKKMLDNTLNNFYNLKMKDEELPSEKKMYTKEEKERIKEIENALSNNERLFKLGVISETEYKEVKQDLDQKHMKIGGVFTGRGVIDTILKYVQLKGMGWNLLSGIANLGFGQVANIIEAGDGRSFNERDYFKALGMAMHSVKKNASFNLSKDPVAQKIRSLMDQFDILKDASSELYKASNESIIAKKFRWLHPYQTQKRTEYLNQAPVMIAMMMRAKVKDAAGVEHSLWDAYDENGNWILEGAEPEQFLIDFKTRVDQVIKKTHGNYDSDSPLLIKKSALNRLLAQFRTWIFEGVWGRVGKEYMDYSIGYKRKGRYRSGFFILGYAQGSGLNMMEQSLLLSQELLRKVTFGKVGGKDSLLTDTGSFRGKEYSFTEVDAANLRANLNEFLLFATITALYTLIKAAIDDEEKDKYFANIMLNLLLRIQTDITFYSNPLELENIIQRPIAAIGLIDDMKSFVVATGRFVQGDDTIKTGEYAGRSRLARETAELLPFTSPIYKTYKSAIQVFDK
jgi:uncharacterized protein YoxC